MKITRLAAAGFLLAAIVQSPAQVNIAPGTNVTEVFDGLGSASGTWADNSSLPGWYASSSNSTTGVIPYATAYSASSGGTLNSTTLYAFGSSGSSERALGCMPATTAKGMLGWRLVNNGATAITNLIVTYDGEQWKRDSTVNHSVNVSYQVFAAEAGSLSNLVGWSAAPASLTYIASVTGTAGALDGNAAPNRVAGLTGAITGINLQPGQEIWLKWTLIKGGGANLGIGIDNVTVSAPIGQPPVIGAISNITVVAGATSVTNSFTVNDVEDDAAAIALPMPTATSSKENVVPSANVFFGGSGSNRTVYVVGGDTVGTADITVSALDSNGNVGHQIFTVTVQPANLAPTISTPPPTNTLVNTAVVVPFTIGDTETVASSLTVTGTIASYSSGILQSIELNTDASGTNRTITITPVPGANGVGVVTLSVDDGMNTNSSSFSVAVLPDANTVFMDHFDYPLNTGIFASSPGFWTRRNSSSQSVNFRTSSADAQAWIRPKGGAEDAAAPLAYGPFRPGSGAVLFTMFKAQWNDLGTIPVVGDSDGAFILLAQSGGASSDQLMQIATRTNGVPNNAFRLLLSNGANTYSEYTNSDLSVGPIYNIVVRYDVATAISTLWVDGTSEASPGVSATDAQTPINVGYVSIRQELNMGDIYIDDLKVVAIYKPTITTITPPSGGSVELFFSAGAGDVIGDFEVERAATLTGGFSGVSATITSLGNGHFKATAPASGDVGFYRLKRKPFVF